MKSLPKVRFCNANHQGLVQGQSGGPRAGPGDESSMISLQRAKDDDDTSRVMFYEMAGRNLFKELQSMEE